MYAVPGMSSSGMLHKPQTPTESRQIIVAISAVGAITGAGGSNMKNINRDSNAFVTISYIKDANH